MDRGGPGGGSRMGSPLHDMYQPGAPPVGAHPKRSMSHTLSAFALAQLASSRPGDPSAAAAAAGGGPGGANLASRRPPALDETLKLGHATVVAPGESAQSQGTPLPRTSRSRSFAHTPSSPYNPLARVPVKRDRKEDKAYTSAQGLPKGLRSLIPPYGIKVQDLHESLYGCTCQWPIKVAKTRGPTQAEGAAGGGSGPAAPAASAPRTGGGEGGDVTSSPRSTPFASPGKDPCNTSLTIAALRTGHTSTFYPVLDPATCTSPHGGSSKKSTKVLSPRTASAVDESGIQIYVATPKSSPEGMTLTHVFLKGDNIGCVLLFQNGKKATHPVAPLTVASSSSPQATMEHLSQEVKVSKEVDPVTGLIQLTVEKPSMCTTALLVIRHEREGDASLLRPQRHDSGDSGDNGERTSMMLNTVVFGDAPSKYHMLAPSAHVAMEIDGVEYHSLDHFFTSEGVEWGDLTPEKIQPVLRAKIDQHDGCRALLLATGRRPLQYEPSAPHKRGEDAVPYARYVSSCLEHLRTELRAEDVKAKSRTRWTSLQVSELSVIGFDQSVKKPVKPPANLIQEKERIIAPFYLCALHGDLVGASRQLETLAAKHTPAVIAAVLRSGVHKGDAAGSTALHAAAKLGHVELVKLFLHHGSDMQVQNNRLSTPLHAAARAGMRGCMEIFLRHVDGYAAAQAMDCNGSTPLMVAIESRRQDIVDMMFAVPGSDCLVEAVRASDGATLMHIAAGRLDVETLVRLKGYSQLATHVAANGETCLHWALRSSSLKARVASPTRSSGSGGRVSTVIELLLEYGADLWALSSAGETAVHLAAAAGSEVALAALLKSAEDNWLYLLDMENEAGLTPLMKAAQTNEVCAMEMILSRKWRRSRSNSFVHSGWSEVGVVNALVVAAEAGNSDVLLEFGSRVQPRAYMAADWALSLLNAAATNNIPTVRFLMEKKVPPNVQLAQELWAGSEYGDATPLLVAAQHGNHEVVSLLLAQAAELLTKVEAHAWFSLRHNMRGPTPLLAAIQVWPQNPHGSVQTAEHLLAFARSTGFFNISETNVSSEDPWCVIAQGGVEIQLDNEVGVAAKKVTAEFGQEIGVTEVLGKQVRVEFPEQGWINMANYSQPPIAPQETPIHAAVAVRSPQLLSKILDHYGDDPKMFTAAIEQPDKASLTPLLLAASHHFFDVCQLLLQKGADAYARGANSETIFHLIARSKQGDNPEALGLLSFFTELHPLSSVHRSTSPNAAAAAGVGGGSTLGHTGSLHPQTYREGARPDGATAHQAALIGMLLARSNPVDDTPRTAFEVACDNGAVTVVRWLLEQYEQLRGHMHAEQLQDIEHNCRVGYELALCKLPLRKERAGNNSPHAAHDRKKTGGPGGGVPNPGGLPGADVGVPAAGAGVPPGSARFQAPVKLSGTELNRYVRLIDILFQFAVPLPASIIPNNLTTSEGVARLLNGTYLDPLERLLTLLLKMKREDHEPCESIDEAPLLTPPTAAFADFSALVSPGRESQATAGGTTDAGETPPRNGADRVRAYQNTIEAQKTPVWSPTPASLGDEPRRRRIVLPLNQQWEEVDGEYVKCTVGGHELLLAMSRALTALQRQGGLEGGLADDAEAVAASLPKQLSVDVSQLGSDEYLSPMRNVVPVEIELRQKSFQVMLGYEGFLVRMDFVFTQSGVHIQFQRLSASKEELRIRLKKEKRVISRTGFLVFYEQGDGSMVLDTHNEVLNYGFCYINKLETFDLVKWARALVEDDAVEYYVDGWIPLSRVVDHAHARFPVVKVAQVCTAERLISSPLACAVYDNFFANLSREQAEGAFVLFSTPAFEEGEEWDCSSTSMTMFSQALMVYIKYQILQRNVPPLKLLDITGVTLDDSHELMMETWIRIKNGIFSNLSLLRFTSREFGVIEVSPKLGDEAKEVRPLSSLLAGRFALDLKFVTCTSSDQSSRVVHDPDTDEIEVHHGRTSHYQSLADAALARSEQELRRLVSEEDLQRVVGVPIDHLRELGVPWRTLQDLYDGTNEEFQAANLMHRKPELQDKAWAEQVHIQRTFGELTRDNYASYFCVEHRYDVLLSLMTKNRSRMEQANEALDYLSTKGRGIQIRLSLFHSSNKSCFTLAHTKGLLGYVKRHKAVKSLHFRNMNFVDENEESGVLRDFIRSKLLRGLTCTNIDFGKENKYIGEILLTVATYSPYEDTDDDGDDDRDVGSATHAKDRTVGGKASKAVGRAPRPPLRRLASDRLGQASSLRGPGGGGGGGGLTGRGVGGGAGGTAGAAAPAAALPAAAVVPHGEAGLTPMQYFTLEGVNFVVCESLRRYPLHYLLMLLHQRKKECGSDGADQGAIGVSMASLHREKKADLYQATLMVTMKTIQFLNMRDPCYFLKWAKRKCERITPLRLAIHLQLDEIVRCMIGLQKTQGGLLKRMLHYEPERLEMEHFVDLWGCLERDKEHLLPLHAAIIQVGLVDHEDNVLHDRRETADGEHCFDVGVPRHELPYQLANYSERLAATAPHRISTDAGVFKTTPDIPSLNPSLGGNPAFLGATRNSFNFIETADKEAFRHPVNITETMGEVTVLTDRRKLITYVDTTVPTDPSLLGPRVQASIAMASQLISCGFVERSITVGGNPPPRGCKQYIEIPEVVDRAESSEFRDRNKTQKVLLSRTWDRTGMNDRVMLDFPATTLLLALKFAPYVVPALFKWGELIEFVPGATLEPQWLGLIHIQNRKGFTVTRYCNSDETMLGHVNWKEEDVGLNLAHWAAVRDQKRLLERIIQELPEILTNRNAATFRTQKMERTALHYVCYSGSLECLNVLLSQLSEKNERYVGVHALDYEGNTPLHVSASLCHPICTETLLEHGARPYWKNKKSAGGLDPHDIFIASLLHHTHKEAEFHQHNLIREWERDASILREQISLLTKDYRIQRKLSLEAMMSFLLGALFYMVFLGVLCMVVHNKTNLFRTDGYWRNAAVRSQVLEENFHFEDAKLRESLETVGDVADMYAFLRGPLVGQMFTSQEGAAPFLFSLLQVVGTVRMRQLRVQNNTCVRPDWVQQHTAGCYGQYSGDNEETEGVHQGSVYVTQNEDPTLYGWRSPMDMNYPNRGYTHDLDHRDAEGTLLQLRQMEKDGWVDLQTRAVFVEFSLYNPNVHHFIFTKILFELPEFGGCHASYRLTNLNMETCVPIFPNTSQLRCNNWYDSMIFFLECCLLVSVLVLTYDELSDMVSSWQYVKQMYEDEGKRRLKETKDMQESKVAERTRTGSTYAKGSAAGHLATMYSEGRHTKKDTVLQMLFNTLAYMWYGVTHYFWREWNLVDLMCVIMFWMVTGTRISFIAETMKFEPQDMLNQTDVFYDLWPVASLARAERELWACVLVLYFVKLLKHIMILPKLGPVATAITTTIGDSKVLIFFVVFMVIALALMLGFHLLLSEASYAYKSFGNTFVSFMQIVFGQWDYAAFSKDSWLVGPLLFLLCLFLANLVLINVFIAVVGNIYEDNLKKSVERWSWQIIDEYQYKLTGLSPPGGSGKSKVMVLLSKLLKVCRSVCGRETTQQTPLGQPMQFEEFPKRVMRKEAVQRLLKSQQRIQINLAEVNENVGSVKDRVITTAATLERIHEQLDKLDSSVYQLQSGQDELRRIVKKVNP